MSRALRVDFIYLGFVWAIKAFHLSGVGELVSAFLEKIKHSSVHRLGLSAG